MFTYTMNALLNWDKTAEYVKQICCEIMRLKIGIDVVREERRERPIDSDRVANDRRKDHFNYILWCVFHPINSQQWSEHLVALVANLNCSEFFVFGSKNVDGRTVLLLVFSAYNNIA